MSCLGRSRALATATRWAALVTLAQACAGPTGASDDAPAAEPDAAAAVPGADATPAGACADVVGEGYAAGQIAEDWSLPDGTGNLVHLYGFCGKVIYYEGGAEW
jgi:hypothetical protein